MRGTIKSTLWIVGLCAVLGFAAYFAGCGSDSATDAGSGGGGDTGGGESDTGGGGGDGGGGGECAAAGDDCTGGKCIEVVAGKPECFQSCTTAGEACTDGNCYFVDPTGLFCLATGTKAVGDACATANECEGGSQCLVGPGDTTTKCWSDCAADADCTAPATCTDTGNGFSVCAE